MLCAFIFWVYVEKNLEISRQINKQVESTKELYENKLNSETELMSAVMEILAEKPQMQAAWLARDRTALQKLTSPLYKDLRNKYRITHFYFHDLDRITFFRAYNPEKYGDKSKHLTLLEAQKTGRKSVGIEVGSLGTLTLRVVYPWWIEGKLVGYIEMGEEIEYIIGGLNKVLGNDILVLVYKKYLTREKWEKGMRLFGRKGNWDQFSSVVIISNTLMNIPQSLVNLHEEHHEHHEISAAPADHDISVGGRFYRVGFFPLLDIASREVGDMLVLYETTKEFSTARYHILVNSIACIIIGGVLFGLFSIVLGRTEKTLYRKHYFQMMLNAVLNASLKQLSLDMVLDRIIDQIISIPWLDLELKGAIFLVGEQPDKLVLKSFKNFSQKQQNLCAEVGLGKCVCGKAALTRKIQYADCSDGLHEIQYEGIAPHGHYCVPIVSSSKLLGVLNLYVKEGHRRDKEEEDLMQTLAKALAGIIERKQLEERLRKDLMQTLAKALAGIIERKQLEERLRREAMFDALTGLLNRRHLSRNLHTAMTSAKRYNYPLSLCLFDVDHFKSINDNHGHSAGDQVLIALSKTIKEEMRQADFAGRYGGDEFCVIFPHTGASDGEKCLERMRRKIEEKVLEEGVGLPFSVTCSFGLAEMTSGMADQEELLKIADQAMYQAKKGGGNRIIVFHPEKE
jgi:diguanylate cyclase (GGDEF)-like protein